MRSGSKPASATYTTPTLGMETKAPGKIKTEILYASRNFIMLGEAL
jgi:hypothetical protein